MFVDVLIKVPLGIKETYTYEVSQKDEENVAFGKRCEVNFNSRVITAIIINVHNAKPDFKTKPIIRVLDEMPVLTEELYSLSSWMARYYVSSLSEVVYSIISFKKAKLARIFNIEEESVSKIKQLTDEQQFAVDTINSSIDEDKGEAFYLFGVTGSGKTEVYLSLAENTIKKGKTVIFLVPEIGLTYELIQRIIMRFEKDKVAVLHSGLTDSERLGEWNRILKGDVKIVLGARSAIFAPLSNIGLIIIDEEHDTSYKSDSFVRYNAKTVAYKRKVLNNSTIVLGSATPSLESWKSVNEGQLKMLALKNRAVKESSFSKVELVTTSSNSSVISIQLSDLIKETLDKKEQAIIFLNKRGFLHRQECPECGHVKVCPHCSIPLTYHKQYNRLVCHECGRMYEVDDKCENCGAETTLFKSYGTELVEKELSSRFPFARILRLDSDTTARKGSFEKGIKAFRDGKADILVGTKMVAKGLNFPHVSLVGVINALSNYSASDFRSDEQLFDLIEQVAGRSGRFMNESTVLVQSSDSFMFPLLCVQNHDTEGFLNEALLSRKLLALPPYTHYARLIVKSKKEESAEKINKLLKYRISSFSAGVEDKTKVITIVESGKCPYEKLQDYYRYHCVLSSKSVATLSYAIKSVLENITLPYNVTVTVDVDPLSLT